MPPEDGPKSALEGDYTNGIGESHTSGSLIGAASGQLPLGTAREEGRGRPKDRVPEVEPTVAFDRRTPVTPDDVTVVIPTLNEEKAIGPVIDELEHEGFTTVLVVDGHSTDGTVEVAQGRGVTVIKQRGVGKGGAIETAASYVTTPFMLVIDGDGTYPAADAFNLLDHASQYDEVIGGRTAGRDNIPRINRLGNRLISWAFRLLFDVPVTDVLSGMYVVSTETVREMHLNSTSFDIEVEIACNVASSGRITQAPIGYRPRIGEQKLRSADGRRILSTVVWMAYYNNPLLLYSALMGLLAIPAVALFSYTAYASLVLGTWHIGLALLGVACLLLSTEGLMMGLLALLTKRSESRILRELKKLTQ
jgi:dolichol-phosphate hexosyltransferase